MWVGEKFRLCHFDHIGEDDNDEYFNDQGECMRFKLNSNNQDIKYIIDNVFYTRTNLGGYSIDIICNNAYIVTTPSSISGKTYEIINHTSINELSFNIW